MDRLVAIPDDELAENEYAFQLVSTRLADYYKRKNLSFELQSTMSKYFSVINRIKDDSAIKIAFLLRKLFHIVKSYGLNEMADAVAVMLREAEKKTVEEMKTQEYEFEINREEIELFVERITSDGLETAVQIITEHYIPDLEKYYNKLHEFANKFVGVYRLCPKSVTDHKGRVISTLNTFVDSYEEKDDVLRLKKNEGQLFDLIAEDMRRVMPIYFRAIINRLTEEKGFSVEWLINHLFQSPVFEEDKKSVIECGLKAYFSNNYVAAIHILIPQVEEAVRNLVELNGINIYKKARNNMIMLKTFDDLLREVIELEILPQNFSNYFRVLYTDPRGWNLRNQICHGFYSSEIFSYVIADRVIHSLLCLAIIRKK